MPRRTINEVYEAIGVLSAELHGALAGHETRITVLENREGRIASLENSDKTQQSDAKTSNFGGRVALLENHTGTDRLDLRKLEECLRNMQISQVKLVAISSLVASVVAAAAIIIVALIR
jgi:hypothetical protein